MKKILLTTIILLAIVYILTGCTHSKNQPTQLEINPNDCPMCG